MLPSEVNTPLMEKRIERAAKYKFPRKKRSLFFEHGHWWLTVYDYYKYERRNESGWDANFDVVDSDPGVNNTGFDFEEVG